MDKAKRDAKTLKRFWRNVDVRVNDECWNWQGTKRSGGYGQLSIDCKNYSAHRVSYELHYGPISDGLFVCHHCDNPPCVNPNHLFLGTPKDNMQDKAKKKRANGAPGKLTPKQVNEIKAILSSRKRPSLRKIASTYGVSHNAIWLIGEGVSYRD